MIDPEFEPRLAAFVAQKAKLIDAVDAARRGHHNRLMEIGLKFRRRPPDGSAPVLVEPPRGPKPLSGGATAALEFD